MRMMNNMAESIIQSSLKISRPPPSAAKRATNLTLSTDVLEAARRLNMNLSQICDAYLRELVREELERGWREEHADFIAAYNACIDAEGLPLNEWKSF
jgi:antitoxin CcdA